MSGLKYTHERIRECFVYPRSLYAAAVFLGCSLGSARNLIRKYRANLVIGDWTRFSNFNSGKFFPIYMWKIHDGLEDKPEPVHPRTGKTGPSAQKAVEDEILEQAKRQFNIELLFAQTQEEVKKAHQAYNAEYQRIYRRRKKRAEYLRQWNQKLNERERVLKLTLKLMHKSPVNQPSFHQLRRAA